MKHLRLVRVLIGFVIYLLVARLTVQFVYQRSCNPQEADRRAEAQFAGALWPVVIPLYWALELPCEK